ncbi:calcium:proton antiporter [Spirilliplanes yamanashiensis]|uniref:Ionic transporter y4hA n=1 Tax=Spirilliplanes yamanashiensis TaxID=42233 RepID=A0A8J3YB19_9ACTN|nr:ionic transporter y4hA [Spirilliplanes yamanashiensis]MDP9817670.1 Ca2+:H+ antiporter [Spirilliplanes yamanashiensis]GIJ04480.1 ionic transporter y4hA [Spirilliplanes yamanashiensis]
MLSTLRRWEVAVPPVALVVLAATWGRKLGAGVVLALVAVALVAAVVAAVHHAEVVAHRVGEPFGTLILAIAVTVIEVGLIVMLMSAGGDGAATLARDTVFAAFMIVCNGVMGLCLLVGALRHRVVSFRVEGVTGALATLSALATLALILPAFTTSSAGPTFSAPQLAFAGVASLVLYGTFVFVQTVRHRDYFLPVEPAPAAGPRAAARPTGAAADRAGDPADDPADGRADDHAAPPTARAAAGSLGLLLVCLVAVVGLAKTASPAIESGVAAIGAPRAVVGVAIALLVLLPETAAAVRAAARNRIQTSFNLALGSALASIGLTIPTIAVASVWLPGPLALGLGPKEMVLMAITVVITTLTVAPGRATLLQGVVHLVTFLAFLFLAVTP